MAGTKDQILENKGYQQITSLVSSTALTVPSGAKFALIQCVGGAVRYRDDGTAPTGTVGMLLADSTVDAYIALWYVGKLEKLRFINSATQTATELNVSYYA